MNVIFELVVLDSQGVANVIFMIPKFDDLAIMAEQDHWEIILPICS